MQAEHKENQSFVIQEMNLTPKETIVKNMIIAQGRLMWANGILFSFNFIPRNEAGIERLTNGNLVWSDMDFCKMEKYAPRIEDEELGGFVMVLNMSHSKIFACAAELAKKML